MPEKAGFERVWCCPVILGCSITSFAGVLRLFRVCFVTLCQFFCNTSCLGKKSTAGCGVPIRLVLIPCRARRQACNKRSFSILGSLGVRKRKFWTGPCNPTATGRLTSDTEVSNQVTKASPKTLQSPKTLLTPMTTNSTFKLEANRPALQKKELAQSVSR